MKATGLPTKDAALKDLGAGTVLGLVSVPDGLAAGLLAGLNPVAGLYGYLIGTVAGALSTSSVFMCVQATGAMAVLIADVPELRGTNAAAAIATLGVLTGLIMLALGILRLGTMVRFVPNAVTTGFINAVAVNIVLAQMGSFTGYSSNAGNRITKVLDTVLHVTSFNWFTVVTGVVTLAVTLLLERTRAASLALVVGVVGSSALVAALGWASVPVISDTTELPRSLPGISLPALSFVLPLLVPAAALAFVGLVQGAAISQSVPNPDGAYPDISGDFRGQGVANVASALLQGMPVGGSISGTALVVAAGARSRMTNLVAGVVMAGAILVLADLAGYIAMPALAALLMLVGVRTLKPDRMVMVWRTGKTQAVVMTMTFLLTLLIPLQYAVVTGVVISVVLFVSRQANKVTVARWTFHEGSPWPTEGPSPAVLPPGEVVVLTAYGSLFFASAQVMLAQLPKATPDSRGSVVVLRLRGKEDLGSTFIRAMMSYHEALRAVDSHLILAGVGDRVLDQLTRTRALAALGTDNVVPATATIGESLQAALRRANALRGQSSE